MEGGTGGGGESEKKRGRERRLEEGGNLVRECILSTHIQGFNKTKEPAKEVDKPPTYRQPWTPEEQVKPTYQLASVLSQVMCLLLQARFEELLRIHPPEAIERRRFEKIANALGTRTTQQVLLYPVKKLP